MTFADTFEEREKTASQNLNRNILYGFRAYEMRKFFVDVEDICSAINSGEVWLGDDYYVFPTQAERDEEFNKLMEETK
jgi:hypothetical protein